MKYLFMLAMLLAACAATEPQPPYIIRIGNAYSWQCGGYAIDAFHIVTASHCAKYHLSRAQVGDREPIAARVVARWPAVDTAIVETDEPIGVNSYATFGDVAPDKPAYAFGYCPMWRPAVARFAQFTGIDSEPMYCHNFRIAGAWTCSGDSGGIIEQDGAVVGMISKFDGKAFALEGGRTVGYATCAVPGKTIQAKIDEWRGER